MKLWAGTMVGMFVFMIFAYQVFALVMIPFIAFYLIALFRIYKCWKNFKYNGATFWLMSVGTIGVLFALSRVVQLVLENALL